MDVGLKHNHGGGDFVEEIHRPLEYIKLRSFHIAFDEIGQGQPSFFDEAIQGDHLARHRIRMEAPCSPVRQTGQGMIFFLWQQSDNVPFEQSRNVPLTVPGWWDGTRTTTDDAS